MATGVGVHSPTGVAQPEGKLPNVPPGFEEEVPPGFEEETNGGGGDAGEPTAEPDLSELPTGPDNAGEIGLELAPDLANFSGIYKDDHEWDDLGLEPDLLKGIREELQFTKPSKIQSLALPMLHKHPNNHLIAQAHNGSGKTTAFCIAMCQKVDRSRHCTQAVCMCPTRELAIQNLQVLRKLATFTDITSVGTHELPPGRGAALQQHVLVGTPGTIKRLVATRMLSLEAIRILVFDEADHMLHVNGFHDISSQLIFKLRAANDGAQFLLFSATFDEDVRVYCSKIMPTASRIFVKKEALSLDVIKQFRVEVEGPGEKFDIIKQFIFKNADKLGQSIIFVDTRHAAQRLHEALREIELDSLKLAGDMPAERRDEVARQFKANEGRVLIATDVVARGFDCSTVTLVINHDLPIDHHSRKPAYSTYLHRIGRSGRFGRKGAAFNFVDRSKPLRHPDDLPDSEILDSISRYYAKEIPTLAANDEDAFIEALEQAGLASADE